MKLIQYPEEVFLLNYRKIIILILLVCSSVPVIWAQNQHIDLHLTNRPLLTAFEDIEKQTRLSISYNQTKLDVHKNITANFQNAKLQEVMQHLLSGTGFSFIFEEEHIVIVPANSVSPETATASASAKQTINGIVVDEQGSTCYRSECNGTKDKHWYYNRPRRTLLTSNSSGCRTIRNLHRLRLTNQHSYPG